MTSVTIKWFDWRKGYGFLHAPGGPGDIFVHFTSVAIENGDRDWILDVEDGERVQCEYEQTDKGLKAIRVWR
jgi:CspA family cold shock protein